MMYTSCTNNKVILKNFVPQILSNLPTLHFVCPADATGWSLVKKIIEVSYYISRKTKIIANIIYPL